MLYFHNFFTKIYKERLNLVVLFLIKCDIMNLLKFHIVHEVEAI